MPIDVREDLIIEVLEAVAPLVEYRYRGNSIIDQRLEMGCLIIMIAPPILLLLTGIRILPGMAAAILVILTLGVCCGLYLAATTNARYVRKSIAPIIAHALLPLAPSESELLEALHHLGEDEFRITARKVTPESITIALRALGSSV